MIILLMIYQDICDNIIETIYNLLLKDENNIYKYVVFEEFDCEKYLNEFVLNIIDELPTSSFICSGNNQFKINLDDKIIIGNFMFDEFINMIEIKII